MSSSIDELKTYVEDYDELSTDEAKYYYNEITDSFDIIFEGLDKSIEMTIGAAEESLSETELMDLMTDIEELEVKADEKQKKLEEVDRKSTRLNSSHVSISYAVFCLKKKTR